MKIDRRKFRFFIAILWGGAAGINIAKGEIYFAVIAIAVCILFLVKMKKGDKGND